MPKARLTTTESRARIRTTDVPTGKAKFGAVLVPGTDTIIKRGTPIGLLLSLTYASDIMVSTSATFKGISPTGRIRNTD